MKSINIDTLDDSFDAIVIGTGITGGWAAKELTEKGLKTLVLERGRMVKHIQDYPTMFKDPWDFDNGGRLTEEELIRQSKQNRTGYTINKAQNHFFVDDIDHPYNEVKRFDWIRGYQVGGRSLVWGRQTYRLSDFDFEANLKEGIGVDWPIRYKDLAPWYDYVENYIGISGEALGLPQLPDSKFLKPMELNCVEDHLKNNMKKQYDDRTLTIGRVAHITEGSKPGNNRTNCQYRDRCMRGCPYGGYFSSQSSTLPAAESTGNMTLKTDAIVYEINYDKDKKRATGVTIIDAQTKKTYYFKAKVIFLCASAIASTSILLQSKSDRFPEGMGNDSGELGHNIMDHHFKAGALAKIDGYEDRYYIGKRPNGIYIPRFRNLGGNTDQKNFLRGYAYQGGASREDWTDSIKELGFGKKLTKRITEPGDWIIGLLGFGETLPYHENRLYLDDKKRDPWGLPTVTFDAEFKNNELEMRKDMIAQSIEMLDNAGFKEISTWDDIGAIGLGIHEMGTARMGRDPKTSVLNAYNQIHSVPNVYVTDGSAMTSSANQNPSLTYMALTARAANHAVEQLNKFNI